MDEGVDEGELLEADTRVFAGRLTHWRDRRAKLLTDSGLTVLLVTNGVPPIAEGSRVTVVTRKYLPLYQAVRIVPA